MGHMLLQNHSWWVTAVYQQYFTLVNYTAYGDWSMSLAILFFRKLRTMKLHLKEDNPRCDLFKSVSQII